MILSTPVTGFVQNALASPFANWSNEAAIKSLDVTTAGMMQNHYPLFSAPQSFTPPLLWEGYNGMPSPENIGEMAFRSELELVEIAKQGALYGLAALACGVVGYCAFQIGKTYFYSSRLSSRMEYLQNNIKTLKETLEFDTVLNDNDWEDLLVQIHGIESDLEALKLCPEEVPFKNRLFNNAKAAFDVYDFDSQIEELEFYRHNPKKSLMEAAAHLEVIENESVDSTRLSGPSNPTERTPGLKLVWNRNNANKKTGTD